MRSQSPYDKIVKEYLKNLYYLRKNDLDNESREQMSFNQEKTVFNDFGACAKGECIFGVFSTTVK